MKVGEYVAAMADARIEPGMRAGERLGPTPQRILRALEAGAAVETRGSGEERQWRISPILQELKRRKTLEEPEFLAACRFLREYYMGVYAGPKAFGYREKTSRSAESSDYLTDRIHYAREIERAIGAVDPFFYEALRWLVSTLGEPVPLSSLGAYYAPRLGLQTQSARGGQVLATLCAYLCRHYGIAHRLTIEDRITSLSQVLLNHLP
jgi:hypothetical protein